MLAAKEKTLSPSSRSTFTWSPRGTYVQAAATLDRKPSTMNDVQPVVSRFTLNDFRARKSKKSPIGSTVKSRPKSPWQNQHSAEKTLGENVVHLRRSHWANEMSQYRAYFVPGSLDPSGAQNIEVTPTPEFGGFSGECGELWAPNYKFGLKDPSKNTGGGYFAQKVEIMCGIAECGCARNSLKSTATVYEVWPVKIKPGLDSYNSGKLQITDQNPIRARQGYSGGEGLFHRGSIYSS